MATGRGDLLAWACGEGTERLLTASNFGASYRTLDLPPEPRCQAILIASTDPDRQRGEVDPHRFILLPDEAVVLLTRVATPVVPPCPEQAG